MIFLELFFTFFKVGLFAVGGGLATLPLLREALLESGWMAQGEFIDMIAVSQATPGPIGINMATYAGFKLSGVLGGLSATLGLVAPSLIIIIAIARFMENYASNRFVVHALSGLRPAAVGMIAAAAVYIFGNSVFLFTDFPDGAWIDFKALGIFAVLSLVYLVKKPHPVVTLTLGALGGMVLL